MKKLPYIALALLSIPLAFFLASPTALEAAIGAGWNATSTDIGFISPNAINGNFPKVLIGATSTPSNIGQSLIVTGNVPLVQIGSSTPTYGYLPNDRLNTIDLRNDYSAINAYNLSSGGCATADITEANDLNSTALNFFDMGHTSSGFTGSGCANNPFTGFGSNSSYLFDPTGDMNFALPIGNFKWFTGGYALANIKAVLTQAGNFGIATTSPTQATSTVESGGSQTNTFLTGSNNGFVQEYLQNRSTGNNASGDLVIGNDKSTPTGNYFTDLGQNSSGYNQAGFSSENAGDSFLTSSDGGLVIGTASSTNTNADIRLETGGTASSSIRMKITASGEIGIGTSTPFANLSISDSSQQPGADPLFAVASTTNATIFNVLGTGNVGIGTTTPGSLLSVQGVANFTTATSTFYGNGLNLTNGCFAVNGTCVGGGGGTNFFTNSGVNTYLSTGTNLGIGTSTPGSLLEVYGSDASTVLTTAATPNLRITNADQTNNNHSDLSFTMVNSTGSVVTGSRLVGVATSHTATAETGDLAIVTRNAGTLREQARITSTGSMGVGSTTPHATFSVNQNVRTSNLPNIMEASYSSGAGDGATTTAFTLASSTTAGLNIGSTTLASNVSIGVIQGYASVASTTNMLLESVSGGACIVLKDVAGTGYTQLYTMAGVLSSKVHTGALGTCN